MEQQPFEYGQRIRVNMPGVGDHGKLGTFKKMRKGWCSVHLDWDERWQHVTLFCPEDLEAVSGEATATP